MACACACVTVTVWLCVLATVWYNYQCFLTYTVTLPHDNKNVMDASSHVKKKLME
jgi:hypothetical protein